MPFRPGQAALGQHFLSKMAELGISESQNVAVALSGGADSLSLALAVSKWKCHTGHYRPAVSSGANDLSKTITHPPSRRLSATQHLQCLLKPHWVKALNHRADGSQQHKAIAMCVDHKLRRESKLEVSQAAVQAAALGLQPVQITLHWGSVPSKGKLMETASTARYHAMWQACKEHNVSVLLTGHHAGDQAETLMMRVTRGSGVAGLAGMAEATWTALGTEHPLLVVRPLLDLPKSQLEEACREAGLTWAQDPTNQDTAFLRNHLRALMAQPSPANLTATDGSATAAPLLSQQVRPVASRACTDLLVEQSAVPAQLLQPSDPSDAASHSSNIPQCLVAKAQSQEQQPTDCMGYGESGEAASQRNDMQHSLFAAVLQVQQRCAAAHEAIAAQAKHVLQVSLEQGRRAVSRPGKAGENDVMLDCCLAVQPFAHAKPAVALHALSAALQAVNGENKQPALHMLQKLLARLVTGSLRGSFTANGCTVSPVVGSKGMLMLITRQRKPSHVSAGSVAKRRHQHFVGDQFV